MMNASLFRSCAPTILGLTLAAVIVAPVTADFTWDGGAGDDLWTSDDNWVGNVAPDLDIDNMLLIFGATGAAQSPDAGSDTWRNINGIRFTGADASLNLIGTGSLQFVDEASIINDSLFAQTISIDLIATGAVLIIDAMSADFTIAGGIDLADTQGVRLTVRGDNDTLISGEITGQGGSLLKEGAGSLTLTGENTYTGGVELNEGTLVVGDDDALGTGFLTVTGDSTIASDDDTRRVENRIDIFEDVELTFGGAFDLTLAGRISGDGGLLINAAADDAVLTISGRNIFTGGTTLKRGILELNDLRALGTGSLTVKNNPSIQAGRSNLSMINAIEIRSGANMNFIGRENLTINSVISGLGSITVNTTGGGDRLILNGANTYEGGTTIERGSITLGSNSALGTGDLRLTGTGTLRSNSDFRLVDTRIRLDDNELRIRGSFGLALDGKISGTGGLRVDFDDMTKRLILLKNNTYTGLTDVRSGILQLVGEVGGDVEVQDEGQLIGGGTIAGNLVVHRDGQLAPGLDVFDLGIDTLTVDGNFELERKARYLVQIDTIEGESDLLDVGGTAILRDGSRIEASVSGTTFAASGSIFEIIHADGGVTDEGVDIITDSATLTFSLIRNQDFMNGDTVFALEVFRDDDAYSAAADAGDNFNIGESLDSLLPIAGADPEGNAADILGALDALSSDNYNAALNELSPEPYNAAVLMITESAKAYNLQLSRYLSTRRSGIANWQQIARSTMPQPGALVMAGNDPSMLAAAIAQLEAAEAGIDDEFGDEETGRSYSVFGQFHGSLITLDGDGARTGFDGSIFGGQAGIDWEINSKTIFGIAAGYSYGDADWDNGRGTLNDNALRAGPYLSYASGPWYLDASVTFGYHFFESDRNIPTLGRTVTADFNAWDVTGYAGAGYEWELRNNVFLTPNAAVQYSYFNFDSFSESGGGGANLDVDSRDASSLRTRFGADLSCKLDVGPVIIPSVFGGWEREWAGDTDDIDAGFSAGGSPFSVSSGPREGDAFYFGFGINILFHRDVAGFLRFEKSIGSDVDSSGVAGGLTFRF